LSKYTQFGTLLINFMPALIELKMKMPCKEFL